MISSGLSLARWKVLEILDAKGSIRQKALAQELGFAERSVTQAVESLAGDGLVERMPDPADGRAKLVTLTDEGAAALAAGDKAGAEVLQRIFGTLDRKQLASLDKLLSVIDDAAGEIEQGTPARPVITPASRPRFGASSGERSHPRRGSRLGER
jgi:DNA-binding MarR family transcriptional regulator